MMLRSLYCTGMDQPANGTMRPPWAKWKSCSTVFFRSGLWRKSDGGRGSKGVLVMLRDAGTCSACYAIGAGTSL